MHSSYGNISVYTLISIWKKTDMSTISSERIVTSDIGGQAHCFGSFPAKSPIPSKEINSLFHIQTALHCFLGSLISQFDDTAFLLHILNEVHWNTGTIAVNQGCEDVKIPVGMLSVINVFTCLNYARKIAYLYTS